MLPRKSPVWRPKSLTNLRIGFTKSFTTPWTRRVKANDAALVGQRVWQFRFENFIASSAWEDVLAISCAGSRDAANRSTWRKKLLTFRRRFFRTGRIL